MTIIDSTTRLEVYHFKILESQAILISLKLSDDAIAYPTCHAVESDYQ